MGFPGIKKFVVRLLVFAALLVAPSAFVALCGALAPLLSIGLRHDRNVRGEIAAPRRSLAGALRLRRRDALHVLFVFIAFECCVPPVLLDGLLFIDF